MRILLIGTMYEPDLGPAAPLFTMLCKGLVRLGHQVTVITAVPHYPTGQVQKEFRSKWVWSSVEDGVNVVRVKLPSVNRAKLVQRFFQFLCFQVGTALSGLNLKYDVVLAANSFLTVLLPFALLGVLKHKPIVYSVQDLYPDVGIKLGVFKKKFVINAVARLERYCLLHSAIIQIISDSFRPGLRALGVSDEKMALVYNWVDTDLIRPASRVNAFAQENNLVDRFIVLYAGNIGLSQNLEQVLAAAEQLAHHDKFLFLFIGDGVGRKPLMAESKKRQLTNVKFMPFQPRERLSEVLACADISLVTLRQGLATNSVPSKTLSILASGRPIVVSVDEGSDLWNLVKEADVGLCVRPDSSIDLVQAILRLEQDKCLRESLGQNGRMWAETHHSPQVAAKKFEDLLLKAIASKQ
ncbi:colanic acid biosynthesis glycosyl transferase WcaI [Syntrophus gentianae]|uniref:Colanic acid biosynthesis glycosyl transferase WcaI n=1 Tax=Syntrophus gentianae TaxID=43775 RepID=A0A1H7YBK6_9BACT|nr:glycosyltransferase family 4 protein [Syntrophus gentianae]SEM42708.1 colanic acid biosynthesis glycosyl transferase WcaI [Syntrophus gentianae]